MGVAKPPPHPTVIRRMYGSVEAYLDWVSHTCANQDEKQTQQNILREQLLCDVVAHIVAQACRSCPQIQKHFVFDQNVSLRYSIRNLITKEGDNEYRFRLYFKHLGPKGGIQMTVGRNNDFSSNQAVLRFTQALIPQERVALSRQMVDCMDRGYVSPGKICNWVCPVLVSAIRFIHQKTIKGYDIQTIAMESKTGLSALITCKPRNGENAFTLKVHIDMGMLFKQLPSNFKLQHPFPNKQPYIKQGQQMIHKIKEDFEKGILQVCLQVPIMKSKPVPRWYTDGSLINLSHRERTQKILSIGDPSMRAPKPPGSASRGRMNMNRIISSAKSQSGSRASSRASTRASYTSTRSQTLPKMQTSKGRNNNIWGSNRQNSHENTKPPLSRTSFRTQSQSRAPSNQNKTNVRLPDIRVNNATSRNSNQRSHLSRREAHIMNSRSITSISISQKKEISSRSSNDKKKGNTSSTILPNISRSKSYNLDTRTKTMHLTVPELGLRVVKPERSYSNNSLTNRNVNSKHSNRRNNNNDTVNNSNRINNGNDRNSNNSNNNKYSNSRNKSRKSQFQTSEFHVFNAAKRNVSQSKFQNNQPRPPVREKPPTYNRPNRHIKHQNASVTKSHELLSITNKRQEPRKRTYSSSTSGSFSERSGSSMRKWNSDSQISRPSSRVSQENYSRGLMSRSSSFTNLGSRVDTLAIITGAKPIDGVLWNIDYGTIERIIFTHVKTQPSYRMIQEAFNLYHALSTSGAKAVPVLNEKTKRALGLWMYKEYGGELDSPTQAFRTLLQLVSGCFSDNFCPSYCQPALNTLDPRTDSAKNKQDVSHQTSNSSSTDGKSESNASETRISDQKNDEKLLTDDEQTTESTKNEQEHVNNGKNKSEILLQNIEDLIEYISNDDVVSIVKLLHMY